MFMSCEGKFSTYPAEINHLEKFYKYLVFFYDQMIINNPVIYLSIPTQSK